MFQKDKKLIIEKNGREREMRKVYNKLSIFRDYRGKHCIKNVGQSLPIIYCYISVCIYLISAQTPFYLTMRNSTIKTTVSSSVRLAL
jgi:hypothetical protein